MAALLVLLLILGCFMETVACILILTPMLLPVFVEVGISPVHFGIVMMIALALGFCTPPVGVNLYVGCGISQVPFSRLCIAVLPFLLAMLVALLIVTYVPALSLCLI